MKELDVYRSLWREAQIKSTKPRDTPIYYSALTESTDKYDVETLERIATNLVVAFINARESVEGDNE